MTPGRSPHWTLILKWTVSRQARFAVAAVIALMGLVTAVILLAVPTQSRHDRAVEFAYQLLQSVPPSDQWLLQLPPERLATVKPRLATHVAKYEIPFLGILFAGLLVAWFGYTLLARRLNGVMDRLMSQPTAAGHASTQWGRPAHLVFWLAIPVGILVHLPYAVQSIRFDEDLAALQAANGWWLWACNFAGWQVHVASMFTLRISTAMFGLNLPAIRLPAIIASTIALAALGGVLSRRFGGWVGLSAVVLTACLPLWAEQTSLARGYGLSSAAACMLIIAFIRLYDEGERPTTTSMVLLWIGVFVGALAHFFFFFLVLGVLACVAINRRIGKDLRLALLVWIGTALAVPSLWLILGLPSTLMQSGSQTFALSSFAQSSIFELGFRHHGVLAQVITAAVLCVVVAAVNLLPRIARWQVILILLLGIGLPIAMRPAWLFPRFFVHLVPLIACVVAALAYGRNRTRSVVAGAVVVSAIALLLSMRPWSVPVFADLKQASTLAAEFDQSHGKKFATDVFLSASVRFYEPALKPRFVNVKHPLPDDVEWLLVASHVLTNGNPPGFTVVQKWPGTESDVLLMRRVDTPNSGTRPVAVRESVNPAQ